MRSEETAPLWASLTLSGRWRWAPFQEHRRENSPSLCVCARVMWQNAQEKPRGAETYFASQFQRCPSTTADKGLAEQFSHGGQEEEKRRKSGQTPATHFLPSPTSSFTTKMPSRYEAVKTRVHWLGWRPHVSFVSGNGLSDTHCFFPLSGYLVPRKSWDVFMRPMKWILVPQAPSFLLS